MRDLDSTDPGSIDPQDTALYRASLSLERVRREVRERDELRKERDLIPCSVCSALLSCLDEASTSRTEISLDTWGSLLQNNTCRNHAVVFPARASLTNQVVTLRKPANKRLLYVEPDAYRSDVSMSFDAPWEGFRPHEIIGTTFNGRSRNPRPRIIDEEWIDMDLPRAWLSECFEHHHDTCNLSQFELSPTSHDLILVDTVQACLIRPESPCRYLALSYVWGRVNNFLTTVAAFQQLCAPGALNDTRSSTSGMRLPRTIDQAMRLTRALGERYIWVDSLCIIQDGSDKVDQLNAMASIFANASLTIVVAHGTDADAGFRGLRNISERREARQYIAQLSPDQCLVRPSSKHVWDDSLLEPWSTRSWTFQESIFSQRTLQFAHNSVRWCCRKARWSEESESSDCLRAYSSLEQRQLTLNSPQLSNCRLPILDEYESLVNGFNIRKLTYPEDALSAFAGVSAKLGAKFSGGLISGIPDIFFDVCLLWRPMRRLGPALRRRSSSISGQQNLPSWSWAGWDTEVTWPYTWNRHEDPAGPVAIMFGDHRPFYQVIFFTTAEDGEIVPVNNSWLIYARVALDEQLPSVWRSSKVSDLELQEYGESGPVLFYKHNAEPSAAFWVPVPEGPPPVSPRTVGTLQFETMSGQFRLGETRRSMSRICTLDGSAAGTLWQHNETDDDFLQATNGPFEARSPIELVAILGCTIPRDELVIWDPTEASISTIKDRYGELSRTEDIYNVMWIQRVGEKSYRKATGIVSRAIWESSELIRVRLNLE